VKFEKQYNNRATSMEIPVLEHSFDGEHTPLSNVLSMQEMVHISQRIKSWTVITSALQGRLSYKQPSIDFRDGHVIENRVVKPGLFKYSWREGGDYEYYSPTVEQWKEFAKRLMEQPDDNRFTITTTLDKMFSIFRKDICLTRSRVKDITYDKQSGSFVIEPRNSKGDIVHGVEFEMNMASAAIFSVYSHVPVVHENTDGTISVEFGGSHHLYYYQSGELTVSVRYNEGHITGSPFKIPPREELQDDEDDSVIAP
jgi:hypothetical protein